MGTRILACKCVHAYQDERYGKGRRVHNAGKAQGDYRCTVCGDLKRWQNKR